MKLKRILSKQTIQKRESGKDAKGGKPANLLFRTSGGLCFDVCPDDKTMYVSLLQQTNIFPYLALLVDICVVLKKVSFIVVLSHTMNNT